MNLFPLEETVEKDLKNKSLCTRQWFELYKPLLNHGVYLKEHRYTSIGWSISRTIYRYASSWAVASSDGCPNYLKSTGYLLFLPWVTPKGSDVDPDPIILGYRDPDPIILGYRDPDPFSHIKGLNKMNSISCFHCFKELKLKEKRF